MRTWGVENIENVRIPSHLHNVASCILGLIIGSGLNEGLESIEEVRRPPGFE